MDKNLAQIPAIDPAHRTAIFAGGCFWCMQPPYDATPGVIATVVGFAGGKVENPSYEQVCAGGTGHLEAVLVIYDPEQISYADLVEIFWRSIDPTQTDGQFGDRASHYLTAILVANEEERAVAEQSKQALADSGYFDKPIASAIIDSTPFYPAEEYHQKYYLKQQAHYQAYKEGSVISATICPQPSFSAAIPPITPILGGNKNEVKIISEVRL